MALATLHESAFGELRLHQVMEGRLVVVRGGLNRLAAVGQVHRAALESVSSAVSPDAAGYLEERGLEQLHHVAGVGEVRAVRDELDQRVRPAARRLLLRFARTLPPQGRRLYVSDHLGVRIMPPRSAVRGPSATEQELSGYTGFLLPAQAHTDSWFNTAVNSVNLWMAVSRVRRDNGLTIWPDAYRRPLRHDGVRLLPDQWIGDPVEIELDPGDLLLFAGDHLHATRPNTGPETRWVVTKRLCFGPPRYHPRATGWVPYSNPRLLGTPLQILAPLRSALTLGGLRQFARGSDRLLSRLVH
ncbi:phytanoyl-CoA dioxygenase family protein [Streptomyces sp. NPDC006463]|uniref:phytanoyl-CoA dioxygenase family protein n=1 Tax=Streptomyces sp. NPDC006463 TaxID=3364746 RepID=UPI00368DE3D8